MVIKPLFGSEGRGIVRVSDPDLAYRTCRALELTRSVFYLQEFVPHGGRDIRAFVVGGRLRGRDDPPGRRLEDQRVAGRPDGARRPVRRARAPERPRRRRLLEADYAGVDLLRADDGRVLVIEVNGIPGWRGLQQTTDVDVAGERSPSTRSPAVERGRAGRHRAVSRAADA